MAEQYADKQIKLFSLTANREIAEKISQASGIPLGKMSSRQFSDGEIMINIEETVRGDDIYIIQSTSFPVNDNLWELLIMIDACKRASANTVNIVVLVILDTLVRTASLQSRGTDYCKIGREYVS